MSFVNSSETKVPTKKFTGKAKTIDISEASSAKPLLEYLIKMSNGKYKNALNKDKSDIRYLFCNIDEEDIIKVLESKGRIVSRYPGIKGIVHKD